MTTWQEFRYESKERLLSIFWLTLVHYRAGSGLVSRYRTACTENWAHSIRRPGTFGIKLLTARSQSIANKVNNLLLLSSVLADQRSWFFLLIWYQEGASLSGLQLLLPFPAHTCHYLVSGWCQQASGASGSHGWNGRCCTAWAEWEDALRATAAQRELCWTARHNDGQDSEVIRIHQQGGPVPSAVLLLPARLGITKNTTQTVNKLLNKHCSVLQKNP